MIYAGVACLILWAAPSIFSNVFVQPKMIASVAILLSLWGRETSTRNILPVSLFLIVAAIATALSVDPWTSLFGHYRAPYYGLVEIAMVSIIYLRSRGTPDISPTLIIGGAMAGSMAIFQAVGGESFLHGISHLPSGRAVGFTGSPVFLGAVLVPCFIAAWDRLRNMGKDARVPMVSFALALIIGGIVSAQARGAVVACAAAVWAYETSGRRRWAGVFAIAALLGAYIFFVPILNNRERAELFRMSISSFGDYPWFGWGPDNFILAFRNHRTLEYISILHSSYWGQPSAHSDLGQILSTMGILGLSAYLWLAVSVARAARGAFAIACLVGVWIQAQVNPIPIELSVILAMILGQNIEE